MRIRSLVMPEKVSVIEKNETYGKFSLSPLERGYGIAIGHVLRRMLISSIQGAAITAVKIEDVMHEFSTIENVKEDVAQIILNLKKVRFRYNSEELPQYVILEGKGPGEVKASDIKLTPGLEMSTPDQVIATLEDGAEIKATLRVDVGKGFKPKEYFVDPDMPEGTIFIDTNFSPVRRVKYMVNNVRVGQRTDFEELIMEVWTDGSIYPNEALNLSSKIIKNHIELFIEEDIFEEEEEGGTTEKEEMRRALELPVEELGMGNRVSNVLKNKNINKLKDIVKYSEEEMLNFPNFGKVSLREVKDRLAEYNLTLNMDLKHLEKEA
ncbi:DNA-directed RNA polymerase subunit alpha [candidate division WOR-3 bacterium]|nr:DNA-directed RNA polymerase subunit alpha [candidate division WOR-3 bacterium]